MKQTKVADIRKLAAEEIRVKLADSRDELMKLRFQQVMGQLTDTSRVRALIGFDCDIANGLELIDGCLTGRIPPPIIDAAGKAELLRRLTIERGLAQPETLAIGDGANDIPMLKAAGLGIAFCGKPKVKQAVPIWLDYAGPTGLLYLQGYKRSEFVEE